MPETMKKNSRKDLHTAITELILDLKGDGTVSSIQKKTGVHRNMLTAIFEVYDAQMNGNEVKTKSKSNPRIKNLYWGTNSLITVADTLGIRVSELVRAAEDVLDGLPPWFERRISRGTTPQSKDELEHVFLEAFGCLNYVDPFPAAEPAKKERHYHKKDTSANSATTCRTGNLSEKDISTLKIFSGFLFDSDHSALADFVKAYCEGKISSNAAYFVLKTAVDEVKKVIRNDETADLSERLRKKKNELEAAINNAFHLTIECQK